MQSRGLFCSIGMQRHKRAAACILTLRSTTDGVCDEVKVKNWTSSRKRALPRPPPRQLRGCGRSGIPRPSFEFVHAQQQPHITHGYGKLSLKHKISYPDLLSIKMYYWKTAAAWRKVCACGNHRSNRGKPLKQFISRGSVPSPASK